MEIIIAVVYAAVVAAIAICIACVRKRMKESKACFFMDLFTTAAAGLALAVSINVAVMVLEIRQTLTVNLRAIPLDNAGKLEFIAPLNAEVVCVNLGDRRGSDCHLRSR